MIYYVLYIGVFLAGLLDFFNSNKSAKKYVFNIIIVVFWLFRALRWDTGCDFPQFLKCFQDVTFNNFLSFYRYGYGSETMEVGYTFLNLIIKQILPSYTCFLLITEGFILYSFANLIKKYVNRYQLVALSILLFSVEIFSVRQTISIAILCYSYIYIIERNFKKFIITLLLSFSIHDAMLLMLPMYWLGRIRFNFPKYVIAYFGLIILRTAMVKYLPFLFSYPVIAMLSGGLTEQYIIANDDFQQFPIAQSIVGVAIMFLYWYSRKSIEGDSNEIKKMDFWINLYFGYLCMNILASLPNLDIFYRLSLNFALAFPIVITFIITKFRLKSALIPILIYAVFISSKAIDMPCFNKENVYYNVAYQPYFSIFDRPNGELIRQTPWPYSN